MDLHDRLNTALAQGEGDTIEFKPAFNDQARETICAFSNTRGGEVWIGVTDERQLVGASVGLESLRDWANQIAGTMGVHPRLQTVDIDGTRLVHIEVDEAALKPVWYRGRAWVRVGSTNRPASDDEITQWVLARTGQTWDMLPDPRVGLQDLESEEIARFRRLCRDKGRRDIPDEESNDVVLGKLGVSADGILSRAAILLFAREPQRFYPSAFVRIGRFRGTNIVDDRPINGSLFDQVDGALTYFREHLATQYEITGEPAREVIWEYPLDALREATVNAVSHRDYLSGAHVQVRWHDDRIDFISPGLLPAPLRPQDLSRPHPSNPRNRKIAEAFFYAGLIEQWGSGFERMLTACREANLPEPEWEERAGAFWLTFHKDILVEPYLRGLGLNDRQVRAVLHVKVHRSISNKEYRELTGAKERTATTELGNLVEKGILERIGTKGRGARYAARKTQKAQ